MSASLQQNYRLINIDRLDPESPSNFDVTTLSPAVAPVSYSDVQTLAGQIRQLLRSGDTEGALRGALENAPCGGDDRTKVRTPAGLYGLSRLCETLSESAQEMVSLLDSG